MVVQILIKHLTGNDEFSVRTTSKSVNCRKRRDLGSGSDSFRWLPDDRITPYEMA